VEHSQSLKLILVLLIASGCSTFRKTTLTSMAGAFAGGAVVGAVSAPGGDRHEMHGLLWGGVTAALVGATMVYLHDENSIIEEKNRQIEVLKIEQLSSGSKRQVDSGVSDFFRSELPPEISKLVQPGDWELFETDRWRRNKKNQFIHQDKILEFNPPKIGESI